MPGSSNFLQFNPSLANSLNDVNYNSNTTRQNGLVDGQAETALHNKLFAQASTMTAALGTALSNAGETVTDANIAALIASITKIFTNALPGGYVGGSAPTWASNSTVTIPAGTRARGKTNLYDIELASPITLNLASSGAGGLDIGSETANTWYCIYLIRKSSDGTVSAVFSATDETVSGSITFPFGYDQKAQLNLKVRNDNSSNIVPFVVGSGWPYSPEVHWNVDTVNDSGTVGTTNVLASGSSSSFLAVDARAFVPAGAKQCRLAAYNASVAAISFRQTGSALTNGYSHRFGSGDATILGIPVLIDANRSFDYKTSAGTLKLDVLSYQMGAI